MEFVETFAPVAKRVSIMVILGKAAQHKLVFDRRDVKTALFNVLFEEEIYIKQFVGFVDLAYPDHVSTCPDLAVGIGTLSQFPLTRARRTGEQ